MQGLLPHLINLFRRGGDDVRMRETSASVRAGAGYDSLLSVVTGGQALQIATCTVVWNLLSDSVAVAALPAFAPSALSACAVCACATSRH